MLEKDNPKVNDKDNEALQHLFKQETFLETFADLFCDPLQFQISEPDTVGQNFELVTDLDIVVGVAREVHIHRRF